MTLLDKLKASHCKHVVYYKVRKSTEDWKEERGLTFEQAITKSKMLEDTGMQV